MLHVQMFASANFLFMAVESHGDYCPYDHLRTFNTVKPYHLAKELLKVNTSPKLVSQIATWCSDNFSVLNVTKTKQLLIDFSNQPPPVSLITTDGERVDKHKYLGIFLDSKLKFDSNVKFIAYKG